MTSPSSRHPGITVRHSRRCGVHQGRPCSCTPSYRAEAWSARDGKKIRKDCRTLAEAKAWRADALGEVRRGTRRASAPLTVAEAAAAWLTGARAGAIRNRSGDEYKPSSIRGYEEALRIRVLPELGSRRLDTITRADLQGLVDRLLADGHHPSTIRNSLMPLRAIFRRTIARGDLAINPTRGLELPAVRGTRDRIAAPKEAAALLAALEQDRAVWATAMYGGLRRGELRALEVSDIDLDANVIRVQRSWDAVEGVIEPKSHAGRRSVPIPGVLRSVLVEHLGSLRCRQSGTGTRSRAVRRSSRPSELAGPAQS
jgi:integrase